MLGLALLLVVASVATIVVILGDHLHSIWHKGQVRKQAARDDEAATRRLREARLEGRDAFLIGTNPRTGL